MTAAPANAPFAPTEIADRLALLDLEARYAKTWDLGDDAGWAALFTPDGMFEMTPAQPPMDRFVGPEALAGFCRAITAIYRGVHVMGAPALTISGDEATGYVAFHWIGISAPGRAPDEHRQTSGYYHVHYRRGADGQWRMTRRSEHGIAGTMSQSYGFPG